jgi:alpha-glucosidase
MDDTVPWWHGGTIYQIYPPTFADGDGDGVGDLTGITARLPYLARLGVDAFWLSPIYPSGGVDGGYDVTDFQDVDPAYGDLVAFDRLVDAAHQLGLKVLLDFVPNHTSDRHPWFVAASASRRDPRRDWYIWRDPAPDGGPPNDWQSTFGGPAWRWEEATGQYVMTTFYPQQIDLNWDNPAVRVAVTHAMRWWVDRGVDGFRLDVVHRLSKAGPTLQNGPHAHEYVREIRRAVGPGTLLLGEVWMFDLQEVVKYVAPGELDLSFVFPFAFSAWEARAVAGVIEGVERLWTDAGAWPCWHIGNHDMPRPASRWGQEAVRAAAVLYLTLRGTAVVYQGDEIGMVDGAVPSELRRDRVGRDPCRTPMQWDASANAGFCPAGVQPYLPVAAGFDARNVAAQEGDDDSALGLYRRLLALRRSSPAVAGGRFRMLEAGDRHLVFERTLDAERVIVAVNLGGSEEVVTLPPGRVLVATDRTRESAEVGDQVAIAPHEAFVMRGDPARGW